MPDSVICRVVLFVGQLAAVHTCPLASAKDPAATPPDTWSTNNAGSTNWTTDAAGTTDAHAVPGSTSDVFFVASGFLYVRALRRKEDAETPRSLGFKAFAVGAGLLTIGLALLIYRIVARADIVLPQGIQLAPDSRNPQRSRGNFLLSSPFSTDQNDAGTGMIAAWRKAP